MTPPVIVNSGELSYRMEIPYEHVMRMAREGVIPSIHSGGRRYFNLSAVIRALRERQEAENMQAVSA